ncbi:MAG: hypothetical protein R2828_31990 [Saprospiraceae bacterium]
MRKLMLLIGGLVFLSLSTASAQIFDQGNFILGSTLGFSASSSNVKLSASSTEEKGEGPSSVQFSFKPNIGYFIVDNFALGLGMDYTFSRLKEPNQDKTNDSDLLFGPFFRYYYPVDAQMAFFAETNFGFGTSSDDQLIGEAKQSIHTNIFAIGMGPGFTIVSEGGIGIEAVFKYNFARSRFDTQIGGVSAETITKTNQFDMSIGIQFYFGGIRSVGN